MTIAEFLSRTSPKGECIIWSRALNSKGYGVLSDGGRQVYAHRWIYERAIGQIQEGLQIDHLCRNRACVNVAHLEPVTCRTNLMRGESFSAVHAARTACPKGHPYSGSNLRVRKSGRRSCVACQREMDKAYQQRKRDARRGLDALLAGQE